MKKSLGGQRLGSGNKMQVDLHGFERSTHDLSYIWRSTMSAGTLVPFLKEVALPGDTFDIHLNCDIKTHPTVGPLFGSYKVQLDIFQIPIRLYHSALHNNRLGIGMNMAQIKLPKITLQATPVSINAPDLDNSQINPSCILSYLGIRGVGTLDPDVAEFPQFRNFNAIPFLAYWDIYKNYYANKQEEIGYAISKYELLVLNQTVTGVTVAGNTLNQYPTSDTEIVTDQTVINVNYTGAAPDPDTIFLKMYGYEEPISLSEAAALPIQDTGAALALTWNYNKYGTQILQWWNYITQDQQLNAAPQLKQFQLASIDQMRDYLLAVPYNVEVNVANSMLEPYIWPISVANLGTTPIDYPLSMCNQEGLAIKTYQSDLFNNWLSTEWIDGTGGINDITAIDTSGGSFNIDTLNLSKKVYDMLNRIAVSGGTYNDWLEAVYDHEAYNRAESPVYVGGLIKELVFQEVVSNAESQNVDGTQPLGTLAGKGVMAKKHKGGTVVVKVDEPSYIMGIVSLTPRVDYSQGNKWDVHLDTMDDLHKPSLDQIGFQELITEQMAWWNTHMELSAGWIQMSAGKQPAWINYMTNVNEVRGNFAIASNEMFMTLNRRYEPYEIAEGIYGIQDLTTYIDPSKFNHIFAQTSLDAQNFWTQISIDMTARRKMSAKIMPNL